MPSLVRGGQRDSDYDTAGDSDNDEEWEDDDHVNDSVTEKMKITTETVITIEA